MQRLLCLASNLAKVVRVELERPRQIEIALNGQVLVTQKNLPQLTNTLLVPITLQSSNSLKITLKGSPLSFITVSVRGIDHIQPEILLVSPQEGQIIPSLTVEAEGSGGGRPVTKNYYGPFQANSFYQYDINGRLLNQINVAGSVVGISHNSDRELQSIGNLQLARDQQTGLIVGKSLDSINESASYNSFGEVTARSISSGVGSEVYVRDDLGRIIERSTGIGGIAETSQYVYDPAGQLVRVIRNGSFSSDVRYSYDARGNRLSVNRDGVVTTSTYDNADRLLTSGDLRFSYTAHGDLLEKENIVTGEKLTLTYDERGQLTRATLPNGTIVQYAIDGEGKRLAMAVNGAMTVGYMHDLDGRLVAEVNSNGSLRSHFIYASQAHSPDYMIRGGTRYFFAKDHLGSIKAVVNANTGVTEQLIHYDEFGRVLSDSNPGFQPFGFAGGQHDHQTGLVRFGVRDYCTLALKLTSFSTETTTSQSLGENK